jgi:hypothetical protein
MRLIARGGTEDAEGECKVESGKLKLEIGCGRGFSIRKTSGNGEACLRQQIYLRAKSGFIVSQFGFHPNHLHLYNFVNSV